MDAIRFEPTISPDFAIDRRRGGQAGDLFADMLGEQLKKRSEIERVEPATRRRQPSERRAEAEAHPHGRPIRPVIKHAHTLRGEAKPANDDRPLLKAPDADCAERAGCMDDDYAESEAATVATGSGESVEQPADAGATATAEESDVAQPVASAAELPAVVVEDEVVDGESAAALEVDLAASAGMAGAEDAQSVAPADPAPAAEQVGDSAPAVEGEGAEPTAASFAAALAAATDGLVAASLAGSDEAAAATAETSQPAVDPDLTVLQPAVPEEVAAPIEAQNDPAAATAALEGKITPEAPRPADAAKPRTPRAAAAADARAQQPTIVPASQSAAPQAPTPVVAAGQAGALASDPAANSELPFGVAFDGDGAAAPGWALHLAQGAAGRRPDFIAQLRQHLQDLPAHEQVAVHIQRALREGTGRVSIQLSPAELGRIHVKLEIDEEKRVSAAVTVEKPSTLELLQRDTKALERALHEAGLKMDGNDLSFSLGRQDGRDFAQDPGDSRRSTFGAAGAEAQDATETETGLAAQVDTANGLVDLEV
jgi:flagellar hook-length control protein FliK